MRNSNLLKRILLVGVPSFFLLILILTSWKDVDQGYEGFVYRPYSNGIDSTFTYKEGTYFVAPWNDMVTYNVRNVSTRYKSSVMDKNGTEITVMVSVNHSPTKGKTPLLHLRHGPGYVESFIDEKVKGAIKDVIGRYTYEEVYSTKREILEDEIESIINKDFITNFLDLNFVEIADVDLPTKISNEIIEKEKQKQVNFKTELKKIEEKNLADARIAKSKGDTSLVISANYKAEAIKKEAEQLNRNPNYIEYIKWKGYQDGKGSPYGSNNVFGSGTMVVKDLK